MKKVLFAIAMLCMVASSAFAQEEKGRRPQASAEENA